MKSDKRKVKGEWNVYNNALFIIFMNGLFIPEKLIMINNAFNTKRLGQFSSLKAAIIFPSLDININYHHLETA